MTAPLTYASTNAFADATIRVRRTFQPATSSGGHSPTIGITWSLCSQPDKQSQWAYMQPTSTTTPGSTRKRPDGLQYFDDGKSFTDTTIVTPTAASYLRYANRPARLPTITEQRKNAKYAELAEREHASFSTLALNAYGVFGKEFIAHLDRIVDFAKHHNTHRALSPHPSDLKRRFKTEILATLKGNARYRMQAMQQCLTKSTPNYITNFIYPNSQPSRPPLGVVRVK